MRTVLALAIRLLPALALLLLLDALLFRTAWYEALLEPESTAGRLLAILEHEQSEARQSGPRVLALGDSRMLLRPALVNGGPGPRFASIAVPGTLPRLWFYMLRRVDPAAHRYDAILLPTEDYDEEDWEDLSTRLSDLPYAAPLLTWADVPAWTLSFPAGPERWLALKTSVLKGAAYSRDFQDLLVHYRRRLRSAPAQRRALVRLISETQYPTRSLAGLEADWKNWRLTLPPHLSESERQLCQELLLRGTAPQLGYTAAYHRLWWGRIAERYKDSRTRLILLRLPRGPVVRPQNLYPRTVSVARELARQPHVRLLDEHTFEPLERPELFADPLHLNDEGSARFSRSLAAAVRRLLSEEPR